MKFLIAGLGSIGRRHLKNLLALGQRDIVLYRTHRATLPDDELAGFPVETDLEAALAHQPDAAIISNPTALHLEVAIPAALAGCHLLLEKPVSHSLAGLDVLQAALNEGGGKVLVGFQFRYHPTLRKAKALLDAGAIGAPVSVRAHWGEYLPNWHPWEDYRKSYSARADLGGGVALTLCHPLDYLRFLLGDVAALWAFSGSQGGLELDGVEDTVEIGLRFVSGVLGSVHLDYVQQPPEHTLMLVGTRGTMRWDNASGALTLQVPAQSPEVFAPPEGFERNWLFASQMGHFVEMIEKNETPVCSLEDGIRALELALAVGDSARNGKLVTFE